MFVVDTDVTSISFIYFSLFLDYDSFSYYLFKLFCHYFPSLFKLSLIYSPFERYISTNQNIPKY